MSKAGKLRVPDYLGIFWKPFGARPFTSGTSPASVREGERVAARVSRQESSLELSWNCYCVLRMMPYNHRIMASIYGDMK
jgi:hypothetical protein